MADGRIDPFLRKFERAREPGTPAGPKVNLAEYTDAREPLVEPDQTIARPHLRVLADVLRDQPYLTAGAREEARRDMIALTRGGLGLDSHTIAAIKTDFSLRAIFPGEALQVPGRRVTNPLDLPDQVREALYDSREDTTGSSYERSVARVTALVGNIQVYVVHHAGLNGDAARESIRLFSRDGRELGRGDIASPADGFVWRNLQT